MNVLINYEVFRWAGSNYTPFYPHFNSPRSNTTHLSSLREHQRHRLAGQDLGLCPRFQNVSGWYSQTWARMFRLSTRTNQRGASSPLSQQYSHCSTSFPRREYLKHTPAWQVMLSRPALLTWDASTQYLTHISEQVNQRIKNTSSCHIEDDKQGYLLYST